MAYFPDTPKEAMDNANALLKAKRREYLPVEYKGQYGLLNVPDYRTSSERYGPLTSTALAAAAGAIAGGFIGDTYFPGGGGGAKGAVLGGGIGTLAGALASGIGSVAGEAHPDKNMADALLRNKGSLADWVVPGAASYSGMKKMVPSMKLTINAMQEKAQRDNIKYYTRALMQGKIGLDGNEVSKALMQAPNNEIIPKIASQQDNNMNQDIVEKYMGMRRDAYMQKLAADTVEEKQREKNFESLRNRPGRYAEAFGDFVPAVALGVGGGALASHLSDRDPAATIAGVGAGVLLPVIAAQMLALNSPTRGKQAQRDYEKGANTNILNYVLPGHGVYQSIMSGKSRLKYGDPNK